LVDWSLARALPFVGGRLTGDADAYAYLPASTAAFPDAETLGRMMLAAGFARARYLRLGLGTVALHVAAMPTLKTGIGDFSA
jgi:demethylmenaquinone methyltransferase/2-methoxy-6-polyprenyl-1,4-benzoquinol methylase